MPIIGISVTKSTLFRGVQQDFSNVYYYQRAVGAVSEAEREGLVDEVVAIEKELHSTAVNFHKARYWSADGSPGENEMLFQKDLSGTGAANPNPRVDRERAILIQWPAGKDTRGHPVRLKKFYHVCGNPPFESAFTDGQLGNYEQLTDAQRNDFASRANGLKMIGTDLDTWQLVAKSGRETTGDAFCHRYLEHHQLGDQWRG